MRHSYPAPRLMSDSADFRDPGAQRGLSRREFLGSLSAGLGLVVAIELGGCAKLDDKLESVARRFEGPLGPDAFVQIAADGMVTIWITKSEMGQGVRT
jgi:hypothetical protein